MPQDGLKAALYFFFFTSRMASCAAAIVRVTSRSVWAAEPVCRRSILIIGLQAALIVALLVQRASTHQCRAGLARERSPFRNMADGAPVIVWTTTRDSALDYLNSTTVEFTGLPLEQPWVTGG